MPAPVQPPTDSAPSPSATREWPPNATRSTVECRLGERLAARGFAFPVGHCADVGLSGYILAGGFGWNAGEWGPACGKACSA